MTANMSMNIRWKSVVSCVKTNVAQEEKEREKRERKLG